MLTIDKKTIHRKTRGAYSTLYSRPRQIVVSICPGDLLTFREAGTRTRFTLPIDACMKQAIRVKANADLIEKKKARKARRGKV